MAHVQYSITDFDTHQPIERLLYVSSTTYGGDWISMFHSHSFTELFYVVSGSGHFCTETTTLPIRKDMLITINPNIRHTEKSSPGDPLTYIALGIDNMRFHFEDSSSDMYHACDFGKCKDSIIPLLEMMLREVKTQNKTYQQICQHYLAILLLKIQRYTGSDFAFTTSDSAPEECEFVKNHIDAHYQEHLTLDDLAALAHLNKYHLAHMFSDTYGISPINYLLERRILNSKELLKNSTFSITQIAHVTGFSSANYFSQAFKKYTGQTPRAYRSRREASPPLQIG